MTLELYEWECPYCRRIGAVNPAEDYEDGETIRMICPHCMSEVVVLCEYQPAFFAYRPESLKED
jgi:hypothetical protein